MAAKDIYHDVVCKMLTDANWKITYDCTMAKIDDYRKYVKEVIRRHSEYNAVPEETETQLIFDTDRDHYQLVHAGWRQSQRLYGCVIHIDVKDDKIWIQNDGTEVGTANELVEMGVPKEDIVLAFMAPYKRQFTGFGVN